MTPCRVSRSLMLQSWRSLTFLHWRYPPGVIRDCLPASLKLDTLDGEAWVGLVPFLINDLRVPGLPAIPWLSSFPEMNVRTYVIGPDGERGIWFFTLEAARLPAVIGARLTYGLPYRWARMTIRADSDQVVYTSHRIFGRGDAELAIQAGEHIPTDELTHFLTARFRLYATLLGRLITCRVEHEPWPLRSATLLHMRQDVVEHSGLPSPVGNAVAHFSSGVDVRVGWPKRV